MKYLIFFAFAAQAWPQPGDSVIRISTSLVQIDAIVTDKAGKLVTDLQAGDFEILQDGKPRDITAFSLVRVAPDTPAKAGKAAPLAVGPFSVTRQQVRRTVAIVVDDLSVGFADMVRVRDAVKQFVEKQMRDGDLVAIVTTSGGMGIYSQFTTDRALLGAAADMLRGNPWDDMRIPASPSGFAPISTEVEGLRAGAMGSVQSSIRAMRDMPGRKSMILLSSVYESGYSSPGSLMEDIANEATRAAVSINAIDPGGLAGIGAPGPQEPDLRNRTRSEIELNYPQQGHNVRLTEVRRWQDDMKSITERTGGLFFNNDNGLRELLARALDDQSSYYLLGYNPGSGSFDRRFHKIVVRTLRPGLTVRSRTGYVGVEEPLSSRAPVSVERQLVRDLLAPFQENSLHTRLTAAFRADDDFPRVLSQLWIDGKDLTFEKNESGEFQTEIELVVASFDPKGAMQQHTEGAYRIHLTGERLAEMRRSGILYSISYEAGKPGPYHIRMAVREKSTGLVGTASQFLLAPNIEQKRLALSGIIVKGYADFPNSGEVEQPWLSLLQLGNGIEWRAQVFHPKLKKGTPSLKAALRLYRDRELVTESSPVPIETQGRDQTTVDISGNVWLASITAPGEYTLQVIVTDGNDKSKSVAQTVTFQVAP